MNYTIGSGTLNAAEAALILANLTGRLNFSYLSSLGGGKVNCVSEFSSIIKNIRFLMRDSAV